MNRYLFPLPDFQFTNLLPLIILAVTGMFGLVIHMIKPKGSSNALFLTTVIGVVAALMAQISMVGNIFEQLEMIKQDATNMVAEVVILVSLLTVLLISNPYFKRSRIHCPEFFPLITWAALGGMLMCISTNLLVVFIGLELLSISLYVLAGANKRSKFSQESALKYFLLGAFATGFFLYGIAFLYGASGSLSLDGFMRFATHTNTANQPLLTIGFVLILVGFSFKCGLAPFHQWIPDVYSGAPTNVVAFMATGAKVGPFLAFFHLVTEASTVRDIGVPILMVVSLLSMVLGNVMAFSQNDTKKLLAYSSVANAGYVGALFAGLMAVKSSTYWTINYFLIGYVFATLGVFVILALVAGDEDSPQTIDSLRGLSKRNPMLAASLVIFVLSQIGIGPVAGFLGKVLIISDLVHCQLTWLAVALVANSAFGAFYYFKLVRAAYSDAEGSSEISAKPCLGTVSALAICLVGVVGSVVFYGPLYNFFVSKS